MRAIVVRQRLARTAVLAASVALLAACGVKPGANGGGGTDSLGSTAGLTAGALLVSNGTNTVVVGGRSFTFPTTVTDAVFSPDGSRLAFVNGDGNIATAHIDGTGLIVLTKQVNGVVRSRPAWSDGAVIFAEKAGGGVPSLRGVPANGANTLQPTGEFDADMGVREDGADDYLSGSAPTARVAAGFANGKDVAFQRQGAKGGEVWVSDLNQREPHQSKVADGSEPALSPDGKRVSYVDPSGQVMVLDVFDDNAKPVQVTFGATAPTRLAWSPDGARVAFATATDIESVAAVPAGANANPTTQVSTGTGVPSYLPPSQDRITRIAGSDAIETAIAASQARWPTLDKAMETQSNLPATGALLAATSNLPLMLAGAQMVDAGPLLFTSGANLDAHTSAELRRVLGKVDQDTYVPTVTILGGTDVISAATENAVRALGYKTDRVAGKDPYALAVTAAGKPSAATKVLLVDAADVAGYAAAISDLGQFSDQTVLLTNGSTLPDAVKAFLKGIPAGTKVYAVGSGPQAALAASWPGKPALSVTPVVGKTTAGNGALLLNGFADADTVVVVDASSTSDIIAAIGLARGYGAPVLVVDSKAALDGGITSWLDASGGTVNNVMIVDSKGVIGADFVNAVGALVDGPLGNSSITNPKVPAFG